MQEHQKPGLHPIATLIGQSLERAGIRLEDHDKATLVASQLYNKLEDTLFEVGRNTANEIGLVFDLTAVDLATQTATLSKSDALTNALIEVKIAAKKANINPEILAGVILDPQVTSQQRFFIREMMICAKPNQEQMQALQLAQLIESSTKSLKEFDVTANLEDLKVLTKYPKLWLSLFDNMMYYRIKDDTRPTSGMLNIGKLVEVLNENREHVWSDDIDSHVKNAAAQLNSTSVQRDIVRAVLTNQPYSISNGQVESLNSELDEFRVGDDYEFP